MNLFDELAAPVDLSAEEFSNVVQKGFELFLKNSAVVSDEIREKLIMAYRVKLGLYVRLKILLNRAKQDPDRYINGRFSDTPRILSHEDLYLAVYSARETKNQIEQQLKDNGLTEATLKLIRQNRW